MNDPNCDIDNDDEESRKWDATVYYIVHTNKSTERVQQIRTKIEVGYSPTSQCGKQQSASNDNYVSSIGFDVHTQRCDNKHCLHESRQHKSQQYTNYDNRRLQHTIDNRRYVIKDKRNEWKHVRAVWWHKSNK